MKLYMLTAYIFLLNVYIYAQVTYPVNGVHDERDKTYAFTNATIIVSPDILMDSATLLISKGIITGVGKNISIPQNAVVFNAKGKFIYPSFIDLYSDYGISKVADVQKIFAPQMENSNKGALNWNQAITPEYNAYSDFKIDTAQNKIYRANGFGEVLAQRFDGIMRGTGTFVMLGDEKENKMIVKEKASANYSFRKGSSTQDYPQSQMGVIALLRQTFYDARWYAAAGNKEEKNISLQAVNDNNTFPQIIEVADKLEILRADKIGDEFSFQYIIKGSGDEYQRLEEIKQTNAPLIIPVNYPKLFDVEDPLDANLVSLAQLKHWELAPANTAYLEKQNIVFCFTSAGLENKNDFLKNIRKAIENGLSEKTALAALTTIPAQLINESAQTGTLEKGKTANFIIASGKIFDENTTIYENWINGNQYIVNAMPANDIRGVYKLTINDKYVYGLLINGKTENLTFSILKNTDTLKATGKFINNTLSVQFTDEKNLFRLTGWMDEKNFDGSGQINEEWIKWNAQFATVYMEKPKEKKADTVAAGKIIYPFTPFGWMEKPKQQDYLITNATVWTNEKEGILKNEDVFISNGKIVKIGKNISVKNAKIIDGTNKYLTCGIIDEHSHIAISGGVNEGTQAVTSEVRIGDVINSEDINIYRQLAGGVTTSHILHGSANPIGGQTALIKLRWGLPPEQMKFENADGFIKFALGENVKQSHWGDAFTIRYPQTRMGVEQIIQDAFTRANDYMRAQQDKNVTVRKDLELDALAEIIQSKRYITCHSYVQSEINMLMQLADKYNFKVNTFTHILEGYKVADKMKEQGAAASTFADWWAYKFEVYDAIPYNAAILSRMGIITSVNSDDPEMARRLNQEAAKSIKYGGLTEEEAWKLCTLNPAKMLHIDNRVGSIKEGKDADVVLWNDNPLSIYAKAEKTFVDGIIYYDADTDKKMQDDMMKERTRIIAKMIAAKKTGEPTIPVEKKSEPEFDCDTVNDFVIGNN